MSKSFGERNLNSAPVQSHVKSSAATSPTKARQKGASADKIGLKIGLGAICIMAVALALWALMTHQASFMMIFFAMFVFAMILTLAGQFVK